MTTRTHHTPSPKAAQRAKAPSTPAARTMKVDAAKAADQAEQEKLARAKQLESAKPEAGTEAAAEGQTMADASSIGALEGAGAVSPLAIGAGVLGVAAIAAASDSGGGSSNNSSANTPAPIGQNPHGGNNQPGTSTDKTDTTPKPGGSEKPQGGPPQGGNGTQGSEEPQAGEKPQTPPRYAQAEAKGTPDKPLVSIEGETRLTQADDLFKAKLAEAGHSEASPKFIRIGRVQASNDPADPDARVVRFPEESDAQASHTRTLALKAPEAAAAGPELTAYEVIKSDKPLTYEEARAAAEKLGGKLLVVDNEAEAQWLNEHFLSRLGENGDPANLATNGAWIGSNKLPGKEQTTAAIRNPGEKLTEAHYYTPAEGQTFKAFVIEFANYKTPLTLNGKPVLDGSVIDAADFDKLVWNGDFNQSGSIEFSVVDSRDAKQEGTITDTMVLQESADVIRQELPADNGTDHQPDNTQPGNDQPGSNEGQPAGNDGDGGKDNSGSNNPGGGSQDLNRQPSPGAGTASPADDAKEPGKDTPSGQDPAVPGQQSKPAAPEYDQDSLRINVEENQTYTFSKDFFDGKQNDVTHVKIEAVKNGTDGSPAAEANTLKLGNEDISSTAKVITVEQAATLVWDASKAQGGSFQFTPVNAQGVTLPDAKVQTVTITETQPSQDQSPEQPVPSYATEAHVVDVANGKTDITFDKAVFEGTNVKAPAKFIKITEIKDKHGENASPGSLKKGESPQEVGSIISFSDFTKITWDASKSEGGSFKFTPVSDDRGTEIVNAPTATVTINEHPVPPTYNETGNVPAGYNNTNVAINKALIVGTGTEAKFIKITEINSSTDSSSPSKSLKVNGQGVSVNQTLTVDELANLTWDASHTQGGSFKFIPVLEGGKEHLGASVQTITINEDEYRPEEESMSVEKNTTTPLAKNLFDLSLDGNENPAFIKITNITAQADELTSARIVRPSEEESSTAKTAYQVIKVEQGITLEAAKQAAQAMGGRLLEITDDTELSWIKKDLIEQLKLDEVSDEVSDVTKGAWFINPESGAAATGANEKEGILFTGSDSISFTFTDADPSNGKMSAYVVEFENYNPETRGLKLAGDNQDTKNPVTLNQVIDNDELSKLHWDSMFNNGGSITFVEVISRDNPTPVEGAKEKTINITEKDPVALATRSLSTSLPDVSNLLADDQPSLPGI